MRRKITDAPAVLYTDLVSTRANKKAQGYEYHAGTTTVSVNFVAPSQGGGAKRTVQQA